jgi:2-dehydropantoate 2-reductase
MYNIRQDWSDYNSQTHFHPDCLTQHLKVAATESGKISKLRRATPIPHNTAMRILVIGAGAVGGYFGGRLAQAGRDVTFLVRSRQAEAIRKHGLRIVSPHGDATLQPKLLLAAEIAGSYDLIILCVKAYSLAEAMNDFAAAVGPDTTILPLLNGMRHLDLLAARFGEQRVIGGVCLIAAEVDTEGRIVQLTDIHRLVHGERKGGQSPRVSDVDEAMQSAGFEARTSANILQDMWEKWVLLASLGAATCLMRGNIGEIEAIPGGADLARAILGECRAIALACGYAPGAAFLARTEKMLTTPRSTLTSSMYRDMSKSAPVEVDQILGDLLERGRNLSVSTPLLEAASANLRIYQARLSASPRSAPTQGR